MDDAIISNGLRLGAHFGRPVTPGPGAGVLLLHGFPRGPRGAAASAATFPELADRITRQLGWTALAINLRGTGSSEGEFSAAGWLEDIRAAVEVLVAETNGVWLLGVAEGGTLAVVAAADDSRVRGVATMGAPRTLGDVARDAGKLRAYSRAVGMVGADGPDAELGAWARAAAEVDAVRAASKVAPRPVLVMHGADDDVIALDDARALESAIGPSAQLHVVPGGAHRLRHDPRAVATVLGWLEQQPVSAPRLAGTPPGDGPPTLPT